MAALDTTQADEKVAGAEMTKTSDRNTTTARKGREELEVGSAFIMVTNTKRMQDIPPLFYRYLDNKYVRSDGTLEKLLEDTITSQIASAQRGMQTLLGRINGTRMDENEQKQLEEVAKRDNESATQSQKLLKDVCERISTVLQHPDAIPPDARDNWSAFLNDLTHKSEIEQMIFIIKIRNPDKFALTIRQ